jgi:hypothetical protein
MSSLVMVWSGGLQPVPKGGNNPALSKGGTNPACKNMVYDIANDIRYYIGYDIGISNIQYYIIYDIGYDIGISVYITCLNCCMNRNAWWRRSWHWQRKRLESLVELLLGHIIIIRQILKKAGIGSKLGSRSRRNVLILVLIIAHFICVHLPITVKIIIIIIWIICWSLEGTRDETKQKSVPI